ncbi:SiaB family protein kinase [Eisenibacter elegans]|jgi:hypothetical protein|uniref:SiaB family protein kinase n=1 Tax=Eisenibacter elegans TaxID=997 RepID=UPI001FE0F8DE|nr:SiaB family protein kinase [Eisenibacter elegans]
MMKLNVNLIKSVLTIYDELLSNGISLVYLGEFSQDITKMFTSMAEEDMDKNQENPSVRRKVYHVMVETLQNLAKHSDEIADQNETGRGLFMIGKKDENYYIITSNRIAIDKKIELESALLQVNQASPEELKEMYRKQIKEGKLSEKGGAGLGLIDMARKVGEKLDYHFLPYDDNYFFFVLNVVLNSKKLSGKHISSAEHDNDNETPADEAPTQA